MLSFFATSDATDFGSLMAAIAIRSNEKGTRYKGQLTIQPDGSIVRTKTDRGDDQLLIPYTHLSHTGDSLEEEIVE